MSSICGCCGTIQTSEFGIVESCGKFENIKEPGCFVVMYPCTAVVDTVSSRVCELDIKCETKTLDNVFVLVAANVQYRIKKDSVYQAYYELENAEEQMKMYVYDVIRAQLPTMTLDRVFEAKDDVSVAIMDELKETMGKFGYEILSALINDLLPDPKVRNAMNEINASRRLKEAATQRAEGEKLLRVKRAQAESEGMYLSGEGVAKQRQAIMAGMKDSIRGFSDANVASVKDVMDLIVVNQYYDTLSEIGNAKKSKVVFTNSSRPDSLDGLLQSKAAD